MSRQHSTDVERRRPSVRCEPGWDLSLLGRIGYVFVRPCEPSTAKLVAGGTLRYDGVAARTCVDSYLRCERANDLPACEHVFEGGLLAGPCPCGTDTWCGIGAVCQPRVPAGSACFGASQCQGRQACIDGVCVPLRDVG